MSLSSDTISEKTTDSGVTIDSVKLKDGSVQLGTSGNNTISNSAGNTAITLPRCKYRCTTSWWFKTRWKYY